MRIQVSNSIRDSVYPVAIPSGKNPVHLGSSEQNDVVLGTNLVPESAGAIYNDGDGLGWKFCPLCDGWKLDEQLLYIKRPVVINNQQSLDICHFSLTVTLEALESDVSPKARHKTLDLACSEIVSELHASLLEILSQDKDRFDDDEQRLTDDYILRVEQLISTLADKHPRLPTKDGASTECADHFAGSYFRSQLLHLIVDAAESGTGDKQQRFGGPWSRLRSSDRERDRQIRTRLTEFSHRLNIQQTDEDISSLVERVELDFWPLWDEIIETIPVDTVRYMFLASIRREIKDIMYGLGPLEDLLEDPGITEIMVNDANNIFIEKGGSIENSGRRFVKDVLDVVQRIVSRVHRSVNTADPMVDARLPDGSRVNAIIKPLTVKGPCLTIRRFPQHPLTIERLIELNSLSYEAKEFLRATVLHKSNILVAGGTGTGKTTLLNALSEFVPDKERIITIEDTAELRLQKSHVVSLETKQQNVEGKGEVTIRMLVKNSLRMRPDRIIVGECRGGEALDMLQAMNTGHDGSMTTIHANSPEDVIGRLEVMVQQSADSSLPVESIHHQIVSALDLVVQLKAELVPNPKRDGSNKRRKIVSMISEVVGIAPEGDIIIKPIFERRNDKLVPTGRLPTFIDELVNAKLLKLKILLQGQPPVEAA